ncbi:AAA domain (dynein-related subfamily) [Ruminococcaceae bacterium FB2012]|nr:AAA domain (dynein-related subfamily) [Ruminococcaceae bacterium FB2012]
MNIKQAGEQIRNTVKAYLATDEAGRPLIPQHKQRPIFLIGAPGIGKTEIISQVASDLGIGLLTYSMTHHTRQSAMGLPIIRKKEFEGMTFEATEYTMSEIIAAVYDLMERSGVRSGLLFLDEINCVSETLTPVMLQFLQYKEFGGRRLPEGWIVVTAGNPPEYNSSVREFDTVTWDRLKRIDVEPDMSAWKEYTYSAGVHGAVISYLEIKPQNFYRIEKTASGRSFVTARGWDDLSRVLGVYEKLGIPADKELVGQYIQDRRTSEDFAAYYELYRKYQSDYRIDDILSGCEDAEISDRAQAASFDERYALLGLMLDAVGRECGEMLSRDGDMMLVKKKLSEIKDACAEGGDAASLLRAAAEELDAERDRLISANNLSKKADDSILRRRAMLLELASKADGGFDSTEERFKSDAAAFIAETKKVREHLDNTFRFTNRVFGTDRELLIILTEVAANPNTARFIGLYGCDEYYRYDKELMFHERRLEIIDELNRLHSQGGDAF